MFDLERPPLAGLGIDMVPVVETKRHVAVFLNLKNHDIAQGMNGPSPNEDAITDARGKAGQLICYGALGDRLPQTLCRSAWFQAGIDASVGPFFQDNPCFGLSRIARRNQFLVGIGRVHLNRKSLAHIEKLQEQRKACVMPRELAKELFRRLLQQMAESSTFERALRDNAGMVLAVAENPCFTDGLVCRATARQEDSPSAGHPKADIDRSVRIAWDKEVLDPWLFPRLAPLSRVGERQGTHVELPHFQFRISGISWPFLSMYCLCSISLS